MTVRVLHIFGRMNRGGAESRAIEVMRKLDPSEIRLEYCALSGEVGTFDDEIRTLGGAVHHVALGPTFPARFIELLRRREIDVVHSNVHLSSGAMLTLAALAGVRHRVAHFHSTGDEHADSPARKAYRATMRALLGRSATDIIGCSSGALDLGWRADWRDDPRCQVIFYGIDITPFEIPDPGAAVRAELGLPAGTPLVLSVGRFDPPKNQPRTVDVFAALASRSPAHLVFVGRGGTPLEAETRERVRHHGLEARVHFIGERSDVPRLMSAAEVMLVTSTREGLPGVVLEALAAGTDVVGTELPGIVEIASQLPGVTALSLAADDATWADAVLAALRAPRDPGTRAAARARFRASRFAIDACVAANRAVWDKARR